MTQDIQHLVLAIKISLQPSLLFLIEISWLTSHIGIDTQLKILSFPLKYQYKSERLFSLFEDVEEGPIRIALQLINLAVWQSPKQGHTV